MGAMIHETEIRLQSGSKVGLLRLDPLQIRVDPEASRPTLVLPLGIELFQGQREVFLDRLEAVLTTRPPAGPRRRLGLAGTISGTGEQHGLLKSQPQGFGAVQAQLRIELLGEDLCLLDELVQRAPGAIAELSLVFNLRVCMIRETVQDDWLGTTLDVLPLARSTAEELQIQLPRDLWVRELAPALGHNRYRLIAVQLPTSQGPLGDGLVPLFDEASRAYDAAEWRESIQKCRDVRHYVEKHLDLQEKEHVAQAIAAHLSVEPDDSRIRFLDATWQALADLTSEAHHLDSVGRLQAATAHAALLVTATMIQHVGELVGPP
ncbi:MAG TPA: hypothetical protein VGL57_15335 [Solirubrobacteraceae bacterium]